MFSRTLNSIVDNLNQIGALICFNGSFTQDVIEEMGEAVKIYIKNDKAVNDNERLCYNLFFIYIELSQNIKNYFQKKSSKCDKDELMKYSSESIIVIGKEENDYFLSSGNVICAMDKEKLEDMIEYINRLSLDEKNEFYRKKLKETHSESNSAGMGLVDMARRAKGILEYDFTDRDEKFSYFTLKVTLRQE